MNFVARFLGRRLEYEYEVVEFVPGERLVMRTSEGPFPMETTYTWADANGSTQPPHVFGRVGEEGEHDLWWRGDVDLVLDPVSGDSSPGGSHRRGTRQ